MRRIGRSPMRLKACYYTVESSTDLERLNNMTTTPISKRRLSSHGETEENLSDHSEHDRTKAELLESLKTSMEEVLAGDYRPALEVLDEIDSEPPDDANNR